MYPELAFLTMMTCTQLASISFERGDIRDAEIRLRDAVSSLKAVIHAVQALSTRAAVFHPLLLVFVPNLLALMRNVAKERQYREALGNNYGSTLTHFRNGLEDDSLAFVEAVAQGKTWPRIRDQTWLLYPASPCHLCGQKTHESTESVRSWSNDPSSATTGAGDDTAKKKGNQP